MNFNELCDLLPDDVYWGDPLTTEIVRHIASAARKTHEDKEVGIPDYVGRDGIVYKAVQQALCRGCAFAGGPDNDRGLRTQACFVSPSCSSSGNDGRSIIWVKKGESK